MFYSMSPSFLPSYSTNFSKLSFSPQSYSKKCGHPPLWCFQGQKKFFWSLIILRHSAFWHVNIFIFTKYFSFGLWNASFPLSCLALGILTVYLALEISFVIMMQLTNYSMTSLKRRPFSQIFILSFTLIGSATYLAPFLICFISKWNVTSPIKLPEYSTIFFIIYCILLEL